MASRRHQSIEQQLARAELALRVARDEAAIQQALAGSGYDQARLEQGWTLYQTAIELHHQQQREQAEAGAASQVHQAAWERADATYRDNRKIARKVLAGYQQAWAPLGLLGTRKQSLAGSLDQMRDFYKNALANPEIVSRLASYGLGKPELEAGLAEVEELVRTRVAYYKERRESSAATEQRDEALDALGEWMDLFETIAEVRLKGQPDMLRQLGLG